LNHVKEIELFEKKNFKDWTKYNKYLSIKYYDDTILPSPGLKRKNEVSIFSEANQITITIKYDYTISNVALLKLCRDFGDMPENGNVIFKIFPAKDAVIFEVYNVPRSYFDQIDIEIASKKFNI